MVARSSNRLLSLATLRPLAPFGRSRTLGRALVIAALIGAPSRSAAMPPAPGTTLPASGTMPPENEAEATESEAPEAPASLPVSTAPWAEGVSAAQQQRALGLFQRGNELLDVRKFEEARRFYLRALQSWSHPSIHFNLVICDINLGRELEAYDEIQKSLQYDEGPLGPEVYQQALTYQQLLEGRVARLTVSTRHSNIRVTLDGKLLLEDDGSAERILLPGTHQVVATKKGFVTYTKKLTLVPGEPTALDIKMISLMEATEFERPMPAWLPWSVTGGGIVVGLAGAGALLVSDSKFSQYNSEVEQNCAAGCRLDTDDDSSALPPVPAETEKVHRQAKTWKTAGIAALATGAASIATGVVLMIYNSPRPVRALDRESVAGMQYFPSFGPHGGRLDVRWTF